MAKNYWKQTEENTAENSLKAAQTEVVHREIFKMLIDEASNFPTASVRVSEQLIAVEATENVDLRLELVSTTKRLAEKSLIANDNRLKPNMSRIQIIQMLEHTALCVTLFSQHYTSCFSAHIVSTRVNVLVA